MPNKVTELDRQISEAKAELENLQRQRKALDDEGVLDFAILLHSKFCRHNHTDGCAWEYEKHYAKNDWSRSAHDAWLATALRVKADLDNVQVPLDMAVTTINVLSARKLIK